MTDIFKKNRERSFNNSELFSRNQGSQRSLDPSKTDTRTDREARPGEAKEEELVDLGIAFLRRIFE
jgi:hypothetical protein